MRQISFICIVSLTLLLSCDTDGNVDPVFQDYFVKYYGEDGNQQGVDLLINADGSMILLGNTSSQREIIIPYLVKIDPAGIVLWKRQLGEVQDDINETAVDVELDQNQNLIVVSNIGDGPDSRIRLFRINQQGAGIDSIAIVSAEQQVAKSVTTTADNRLLVTGFAAPAPTRNPGLPNPSSDLADVIVLEIDALMETSKVFSAQGGGEYEGSGVKVFEKVINGSPKYLNFGYSDRPDDGLTYKQQFEVIRISPSGNPDGAQYLSGIDTEEQIASATIETPPTLGEGYLMVGTTYTTNNSASNIYITQYNDELSIARLDMALLLGQKT